MVHFQDQRGPNVRIDMSQFGGAVIDRIMKEVDDPKVPSNRNERSLPASPNQRCRRPTRNIILSRNTPHS